MSESILMHLLTDVQKRLTSTLVRDKLREEGSGGGVSDVVHAIAKVVEGGNESISARLTNSITLGHSVRRVEDGLLDVVVHALHLTPLVFNTGAGLIAASRETGAGGLAGGEGKSEGGVGSGGLRLELAWALVQAVLGTDGTVERLRGTRELDLTGHLLLADRKIFRWAKGVGDLVDWAK